MRKTIKARPPTGTQRTKKRFLWWPKTLPRTDGAKKERRWLETAEWIQEFVYERTDYRGYYYWSDIDWVDSEE